MELSAVELQRYKTQIQLHEIGLSGQQKLKAASVIVIGAGGLGCAVLQYLVAAGVGTIGIVDFDRVELSNLHRQILYTENDIGAFKSETAKLRMQQLNPHVNLIAITLRLNNHNAQNILKKYDVVIDATDNSETRYVINDACVASGKPFVYGSIHQFEGQVAVFNVNNQSPNYRTLFPISPECSEGTCNQSGVIGALPGIIGSIQCLEAIKLILGLTDGLSGKLLKINTLEWKMHVYQLGASEQVSNESFEISAETLQQLIQSKIKFDLIDIREHHERDTGHMGELWIPFSELMEDHSRLPKGNLIVLYCQTGKRSRHAVSKLRRLYKLSQLFSLSGGLEKYKHVYAHNLGR